MIALCGAFGLAIDDLASDEHVVSVNRVGPRAYIVEVGIKRYRYSGHLGIYLLIISTLSGVLW